GRQLERLRQRGAGQAPAARCKSRDERSYDRIVGRTTSHKLSLGDIGCRCQESVNPGIRCRCHVEEANLLCIATAAGRGGWNDWYCWWCFALAPPSGLSRRRLNPIPWCGPTGQDRQRNQNLLRTSP